MRVGVYLGEAGPGEGGVHTFVRMQWEALLDAAPRSPHRFLVLPPAGRAADARLPDNVEVLPVPPEPPPPPPPVPPPRRGLFRRRRRHRPPPVPPVPTPLERTLAAHSLDFVWPLEAWHPIFDVPYLTMVWDLQHRLQPWFPEVSRDGIWAWREKTLPPLVQRASIVVVGTQVGRDEVGRFYGVPPERVRVLPHPTPSFALAAAARPPRPLPEHWGLEPGFLFYPAQFWSHKNHVGLLRALRGLRDEHGLAPTLVFTGGDKGNLGVVERTAAALGLDEQVRFLGLVSTEDLVSLYQYASILVYPSLFGPDNLPPLEAFALGCPVIAADVSGAQEQLGDAALRVDALDPAALADAIHRVQSDATLREALIERGRVRAAAFSAHDFVDRVLGILDEMARIVPCWRGHEGPASPGREP